VYVLLWRSLAKDHLSSENSAYMCREPYIPTHTLYIDACPISQLLNIHICSSVPAHLHFSRVLRFLLLALLSTIFYYWDYYTIRRKKKEKQARNSIEKQIPGNHQAVGMHMHTATSSNSQLSIYYTRTSDAA